MPPVADLSDLEHDVAVGLCEYSSLSNMTEGHTRWIGQWLGVKPAVIRDVLRALCVKFGVTKDRHEPGQWARLAAECKKRGFDKEEVYAFQD